MIVLSIRYSLHFGNSVSMEYPGARFTRPVRLALLSAVIAAFFIITPLILLYAAGFRYDWQNGFLRETGGLSIDILPDTARVSLDGLLLKDTMPVRLKNITPRKYQIKVSAPGYYDWEKEVTVNAEQTIYIKDIRLLKTALGTQMAPIQFSKISLSPDGHYLLAIKNNNNHQSIFLFNLTKTNSPSAANQITEINATTTLDIAWGEKNYFSIANETAPFTSLTIGNVANPKTLIRLTPLFPEPISRYQWSDDGEPIIFIGTSSTIYSFQPALNQRQVVTVKPLTDWYVANTVLWSLETTTTTLSVIRDALGFHTSFAVINTTSTGISPDRFDPQAWHFATIHKDQVLLKQTDNPHFLIIGKDKQYTVAADHFLISPFNNWWLLSSPSELWTDSEGEAPNLLMRSGELLHDVYPLDNQNTLAFQFTHSIDTLFPYEYVREKLIADDTIASVADPLRRVLYYATTNGLFSSNY